MRLTRDILNLIYKFFSIGIKKINILPCSFKSGKRFLFTDKFFEITFNDDSGTLKINSDATSARIKCVPKFGTVLITVTISPFLTFLSVYSLVLTFLKVYIIFYIEKKN